MIARLLATMLDPEDRGAVNLMTVLVVLAIILAVVLLIKLVDVDVAI